MARFRFKVKGAWILPLEQELERLNAIRWDAIREKQVTEMLNRARASGGTPVDTGELRESLVVNPNEMTMGYTAEYAPHVEYGHRTVNGGFVQGQRFLQANVEAQREIYREDVLKAIRKEGK